MNGLPRFSPIRAHVAMQFINLAAHLRAHRARFSDAQIFCYTLVQDWAIPSGFLAEFESLVKNVEMDATRQARNSYRDEVQSAIWLHERKKAEERTAKEHRQDFDLLSHVAELRPRRFKNRLQRTLAAGSNARRDAEELERSRWVHALAYLFTDRHAVLTPLSVDAAIGTTAGTFLDASLGAFIHAFLHFTPGLREVTA